MKRRRLGRELALKYLFTVELGTEDGLKGFDAFAKDQEKDAETREFAKVLITGVIEHGYDLRDAIEARTTNWKWQRMPTVDRCLLLMGALELVHHDEIPRNVTINEIVELAKKFSTKASGAFVNAVLDGLGPDAKSRAPLTTQPPKEHQVQASESELSSNESEHLPSGEQPQPPSSDHTQTPSKTEGRDRSDSRPNQTRED